MEKSQDAGSEAADRASQHGLCESALGMGNVNMHKNQCSHHGPEYVSRTKAGDARGAGCDWPAYSTPSRCWRLHYGTSAGCWKMSNCPQRAVVGGPPARASLPPPTTDIGLPRQQIALWSILIVAAAVDGGAATSCPRPRPKIRSGKVR
jgi:hypothetical protein